MGPFDSDDGLQRPIFGQFPPSQPLKKNPGSATAVNVRFMPGGNAVWQLPPDFVQLMVSSLEITLPAPIPLTETTSAVPRLSSLQLSAKAQRSVTKLQGRCRAVILSCFLRSPPGSACAVRA